MVFNLGVYNALFIKQVVENTMWKCTRISSFVQKRVLYARHYVLHKVDSDHKDCKTYVDFKNNLLRFL